MMVGSRNKARKHLQDHQPGSHCSLARYEPVPFRHTRVSIVICAGISHIMGTIPKSDRRTEAPVLVARAPPTLPAIFRLRTMCIGVVFVSDLVEELDLVLACEDSCGDAVYGRVTPALQVKRYQYTRKGKESVTNLIVKSAFRI